MNYSPVIIVGAPRSGTNMLRDVLTSLSGVSTWPCDEINYIWRHGNVRYPSDEFTADMATPDVQRYIRNQFDWLAGCHNAEIVVEKTCANSLRVPFVSRIIPNARYIFIKRDGLDVVASAVKRWKAGLDINYLLRKARFVPLPDLPYYLVKYLWNRLYRLASNENRLSFWGPRLRDMRVLMSQYTLEEVCMIQWKRCVEAADSALKKMDSDTYYELGYESFVKSPQDQFLKLVKFLNLNINEENLDEILKSVSTESVGTGRRVFSDAQIMKMLNIGNGTLRAHGYT